MSFIVENKVWLRIFFLALLTISMLGPWTFEQINVPAQYTCDKPFVRLYGDFCGSPVSGFGSILWAASGLFTIIIELVKGNFAAQIPELIVLVCMLVIVLPFVSILLLIGKRNSRRLQTVNVILCVLACALTLALFILQSNREQFVQYFYLLWGLWLYILLAAGTALFEVLVLRLNSKPTLAV